MKRIRRALISVSDKTGLVPFARGLRRMGIQVISTGGTARMLKAEGIPVTEIAEFTGSPEMLGGRVKTLHPKVHGGILARREEREHMKQARRMGLDLIDLVVVNLYPFEQTAARRGAGMPELIEQIDIGGVALIRSAAKNFKSVGVVSRPSQYDPVLAELKSNGGCLKEGTRLRLAVEAFAETSYYDSVIHQALAHRVSPRGATVPFPERIVLSAARRQLLRYGENPHQSAGWYQWPSFSPPGTGLSGAVQLHGKELSFNNLLDLDAALQLSTAFRRPAAVIVKHMNPCGAACAGTAAEAFRRAFAGDPLSAFGGIVGLNRAVDMGAARAILSAGFLECLIAPGFKAEALAALRAKKNLRILQAPPAAFRRAGVDRQAGFNRRAGRCVDLKQIAGGLLVQQPDDRLSGSLRWRLAAGPKPTAAQRRDLEFAWTVAKFTRSNAIVVAKGERAVGIGAGQTSRVDSVLASLKKAGPRARGAVLASDGFFPKPDGPVAAVRAGVRAIVQPGGSIQDPEVIRVARKARIPMLMTGERHFRH